MTGDLSKAINSDVCKLTLSSGEVVLLFDIEQGSEAPRNRRATRAGKLDTYGPEEMDFIASCTCDKATANVIKGLATQNARKAYTKEACTITGQNLGGVSGDDLVITFNAEFHRYRFLAPGGGQDVTIRFGAIIDNSSYAIAT